MPATAQQREMHRLGGLWVSTGDRDYQRMAHTLYSAAPDAEHILLAHAYNLGMMGKSLSDDRFFQDK